MLRVKGETLSNKVEFLFEASSLKPGLKPVNLKPRRFSQVIMTSLHSESSWQPVPSFSMTASLIFE